MKVLEIIARHMSMSFFIAILFTKPFIGTADLWNIPLITWGVTIILFVLSWQLKKEVKQIFIKEDQDAHNATLWGQFELKHPKLSQIIWETFVTFAIIHLLYIALDYIMIIETNGNRTLLFIIAFIIAITFRILDRDTYRKK